MVLIFGIRTELLMSTNVRIIGIQRATGTKYGSGRQNTRPMWPSIIFKNKRDKSKPFFMVVSMNPPHSPYYSLDDVEEQDYNLYKDIPLNELLIRPNVKSSLAKKQKSAPYYKDPYQMRCIADRKLIRKLASQMEPLLKKADDPWMKEGIYTRVMEQLR